MIILSQIKKDILKNKKVKFNERQGLYKEVIASIRKWALNIKGNYIVNML